MSEEYYMCKELQGIVQLQSKKIEDLKNVIAGLIYRVNTAGIKVDDILEKLKSM